MSHWIQWTILQILEKICDNTSAENFLTAILQRNSDSSFYSSIQSNWFTWMQQNTDEKRKGHFAWGKSTNFKQFVASAEFEEQPIIGRLMYWRTLCFECYKKEPQRGMNEEDCLYLFALIKMCFLLLFIFFLFFFCYCFGKRFCSFLVSACGSVHFKTL